MLPPMAVLVRYEGARDRAASAQCKQVASHARRMLRALQLTHSELSVLLCDDRVMRQLNHAHRKLDRPTDVLAFALGEGRPMVTAQPALGDIAIALPTARRQARSHRWPPELEICLLLAHGLLHLLGQDHPTRAAERRMMARAHLLMAAGLAGRGRRGWTSPLPPAHQARGSAARRG
ncbi:MAG TPA: rRNA maturation RNase YbeY [Polyangiales bacterium]